MTAKLEKAAREAGGLIRDPRRVFPLLHRIGHDTRRSTFEQWHLYSYTRTDRSTPTALARLVQWIVDAQREDGGIAAYYSLLSGYSASYPEVTGYLLPTLYDSASSKINANARLCAERATAWLLSLQMSNGAFAAGLQGSSDNASVFNTGQILQGLIRAWTETGRIDIGDAVLRAADWLVSVQAADGSWSGEGTYQGVSHTYYGMVAWSLALLAEKCGNERYGLAAEKNMDWVLAHLCPNGWIDGLNLRGHPNYLHFVAYALQGVLECALFRGRCDAVVKISKPAWLLLRKFETNKCLAGALEDDFTKARNFTCLTGNAQMSCVWFRLFEATHDLRYVNAALKMNELLKQLVPVRGPRGIAGGVSGSYPIWEAYQPFRHISWGCKFLADALILEQRLMQSLEVAACAS